MTWVKLDDKFVRHPKILKAGPEAGWFFVCALSYCSEWKTDGFLPAEVIRTLTPFPNNDDLVDRLVKAKRPGSEYGLLVPVDGGYMVHDYLDWNPAAHVSKAKRADVAAKRAEAGRVGASRRWGNQQQAPASEPPGGGDATPASSPSATAAQDNNRMAKPMANLPSTDGKTDGKGHGKNMAPDPGSDLPDPSDPTDQMIPPSRACEADPDGYGSSPRVAHCKTSDDPPPTNRSRPDGEDMLSTLTRLADLGNPWAKRVLSEASGGRAVFSASTRARIKQIDAEYRAKDLTPETVVWGDVYAAGIQDAAGGQFSPPRSPAAIAAFRAMVATHAVDPDGAPLTGDSRLGWIRRTASEYRRSVPPDRVRFEAGFSPEKCLVWLDSGRPAGAPASGPGRGPVPQPQRKVATGSEPTLSKAEVHKMFRTYQDADDPEAA